MNYEPLFQYQYVRNTNVVSQISGLHSLALWVCMDHDTLCVGFETQVEVQIDAQPMSIASGSYIDCIPRWLEDV